MAILEKIASSLLFWAAWIVIPLIMEVIPAIGSFFILIKRKIESSKTAQPIIYPEITIIIPIYNSQDTLMECLRSVNDSKYPNDKIRIFLVNNKTSDDSFSVFSKCQELYPELHMQWLNAEQGKSRALNLAIYNSNGKYIIHIDSDGILEPSALTNMVDKFEYYPDINCMTGAVLTRPDMIQNNYRPGLSRLFRKLEFMEYAQAFLAGRNYAADINAIYTLSGAFTAFRKSALLKSQLYNTDTLAEDTQITFQMRYLQKDKIHISENSIFFVDPIENVDKLYTQRQRWQRGSLEVSKMFLGEKMNVWQMFSDITVKTLMYDHTFAFPRMIWYLALICLVFIGYSGKSVIGATGVLFGIYTVCGYIYYLSTVGFLKSFKETRDYYAKQWYIVPLLPFFNLGVFFIRLAGVINSINTSGSWKTKTLSEEADIFGNELKKDLKKPLSYLSRIKNKVNIDPSEKLSEREILIKKLRGSIVPTVIAVFNAILAVVLGVLCNWAKKNFTIGINNIINTLLGPMQGVGGDTVSKAVKYCLPPVVFGLLVIVGILIIDRAKGKKALSFSDQPVFEKKARSALNFRRLAWAMSALLMVGVIIYGDICYDLKGYALTKLTSSSIYEEYYIHPDTVSIEATKKPKNLIYIYIESLEITYASKEDGGYQEINYIPGLTKLAAENVSFSNSDKLGGFTSTYNSTWTAAALLSTTSGVPYMLPSSDPIIARDKIYASKLVTLGDLLSKRGYTNEFLCGSDGEFGGRAPYFRQHGNYNVYDYYSAIADGYIDKSYYAWWGLEDQKLFDIAKDRLNELSSSDRPFAFSLLTADTHFPDGFICDICRDDYKTVAENVISCADRQVCEFVEWCMAQPFFENTVIVITGDHPRMDSALVSGIDWYDRKIYNCFINAENAENAAKFDRDFTTLDIFPTVLGAMGFEIEGNRLGLGTNMFSYQRTLAEEIGLMELERQLQTNSDYYLANFAPELLATKTQDGAEEQAIEG